MSHRACSPRGSASTRLGEAGEAAGTLQSFMDGPPLIARNPGKKLKSKHISITMNENFKKFDPAVDKRILVALSGIVWSIVGIFLFDIAVDWLAQTASKKAFLPVLAGITLALLISRFGFIKLVDQNIHRIVTKHNKVCIFAFQPWKSYLIVIIMVGMGIILRNSPMPKYYLSIIYMGMGVAMILSSIRYFRIFFNLIR